MNWTSKILIGIAPSPAGIAVVTAAPGTIPDPRPSYKLQKHPLDVLRVIRIERWSPGKAPDLARELVRRIFPSPVVQDPEAEADMIRIAVDASDLITATPLCRELARTIGRFEGRVSARAVLFTAGSGAPSRLDWRTAYPLTRAVSELAALLAEKRLQVEQGELTVLAPELRDQIRTGTKPTRSVSQEESIGDLALGTVLATLLFRVHELAGHVGWTPIRWTA